MQMAKNMEFIVEPEEDVYELTEGGKLFDSEASNSIVPMLKLESLPLFDSFRSLAKTMKSGNSAVSETYGTELWGYLHKHPEERVTFDHGMTSLTASLAPAIVRAYPEFANVKKLCDIGGGKGTLLASILPKFPQMTAVILDLPIVKDTANKYLKESGIDDRATYYAGDMFTPPTDLACDCYVFKHVLHNWNDEQVVKILTALRKVVKSTDRLLLCEVVLGGGDSKQESYKLKMDLIMMAVLPSGSRQRNEKDMRTLLDKSGFELKRVIPTDMAMVSIVEAFPK